MKSYQQQSFAQLIAGNRSIRRGLQLIFVQIPLTREIVCSLKCKINRVYRVSRILHGDAMQRPVLQN